MRIRPAGKVALLIIVVGLAAGAYRLYEKSKAGGGNNSSVAGGSTVDGDQGILGRPLRVGVVTWPGYCGGIVANGGFKPNKECIYWKGQKLLVEFKLMEDVDARAKAFAKGGPDGVDIVWSTVDFWANELPGFEKNGVDAKAVMQVDYSRGGDAIVADNSIHRIEDLKGKKISLALFTPSHWLLENALENSSLSPEDQTAIVKNLVGKNASPDASADFIAGKVDAAVCWEPDVTQSLKKRPNSHILLSSATAANLIADIMVARQDFISQHPDVIKAFVQGWLDGTEEANRNPAEAAKVLVENEPLYHDLGEDETRKSLSSVRWADLTDNTKMFGLDGSQPYFDKLFNDAGNAWVQRGYISQKFPAEQARYTQALQEIYSAVPKSVAPIAKTEEYKFPATPPQRAVSGPGISTKPVNIYFAPSSAEIDENAKQVLGNIAMEAEKYSNAYFRVEGNTDSTGRASTNRELSLARARAVISYLAQNFQLNPERFVAKGNGPDHPVASNTSAAGRQKNRRTDIVVVPR
jgi:NitT/TauT family transport system substrate-binding protein